MSKMHNERRLMLAFLETACMFVVAMAMTLKGKQQEVSPDVCELAGEKMQLP